MSRTERTESWEVTFSLWRTGGQRVSGVSVSPFHQIPGCLFSRGSVFGCGFDVCGVLLFCSKVSRFFALIDVLLTSKRTSDRQGQVLDRL